jgi:uncharacterized spore protein YtfJ
MDAVALLEKTREVLNARQVIGEPYEKNGITLLPVVSIRGGGGGGPAVRRYRHVVGRAQHRARQDEAGCGSGKVALELTSTHELINI